jgi:hypothetical protein
LAGLEEVRVGQEGLVGLIKDRPEIGVLEVSAGDLPEGIPWPDGVDLIGGIDRKVMRGDGIDGGGINGQEP